jgi:hypothetical protein
LFASLGDAFDDVGVLLGLELAGGEIIKEEERFSARSIPTVSCRRVRKAILSFVPTPSVPETSTGSLYFLSANRPPKPPMCVMTSGRNVDFTKGFIFWTKRSPASMSTPASL